MLYHVHRNSLPIAALRQGSRRQDFLRLVTRPESFRFTDVSTPNMPPFQNRHYRVATTASSFSLFLPNGRANHPRCRSSSSSSSSKLHSPPLQSTRTTTAEFPKEQHSKEKDFQKWLGISQELVKKSSPWSPSELRLVEQCLLHWSLQYPTLKPAMWDDQRRQEDHTLVQLWTRLATDHDISRAMYDYAVHALARWGFPVLAEECLQSFIKYADSLAATYRLNKPARFHTKSIARAYESFQRPEESEAFVRRFLAHPRTAKLVDHRTVQCALAAWRNAGNGERAESFLKWVVSSQRHIKLPIDCYNIVCMAWGRTRGRNDAGVLAEKFIKEIPFPLDAVCWNGVLMAWTNVPTQPDGLHHAESVLWQLVQQRAPLSSYCFNEILSAYGRLGLADRALQFLERWIHDATKTTSRRHALDDSLTPTVHSFNCVIHAMATSGSPDAGEKAHNLMRDMQEKYHMIPDSYTYNSVMSAYAKTGNTEAVETLLQYLETTNWKDFPPEDPNQRTYGYTSLIQAWSENSSSSSPDQRLQFAVKAASVLDRMVAHGITPPPIAYSMVLNVFTYCNSEQAALSAEDLLTWMDQQGVPFNEECGIKVLNAWARIGMPDRAYALLKKMEKQIKRKKVPCAWYNCVVMAYSRRPEPEYAEEATAILSKMVTSEELPDPDAIIYKLTLLCWLRSRHSDKASRAWEVLQQFLGNFENIRKATHRETDFEQLIMDSHVMVLLTCAGVPIEAGPERRQLALKIALQAFSQIPRRDARVYYAALKAFGNLMRENPDERHALISNIYQEYSLRYNRSDDDRVLKLFSDLLPCRDPGRETFVPVTPSGV